ncbi:hypothetical protein AB0G05_27350 [Nonomuraea wenchangensis]
MTEQRTWTIGGVTYTASLEEKARRLRNAFDPDQPRDRKGRWIETGASVSIWGGGSGTVARNLGGGRLEVHTADGRKLAVHRNYLTVTAAPGGKKPSGNPGDRPRPLRASKPSKGVEEFTPDVQDTRVPVSELKPGQLALVYGWDQLGADTYDIGRIASVSPAGPAEDADTKPGTGWAVTFKHDDDRHWTMYANDDAVARVVPEEEFAPLVEAERSGDQAEADRIALGIYDRIMAGDDAEAAAKPEVGPPAEVPAAGARVRLSNGAEGTVARAREDGALLVRLDSGSQVNAHASGVEVLDALATRPDESSPGRGGGVRGDVEQQIIDAHHRIAPPDPDGEPQWVSMERLRAGLPEQDRAEVDETLRRMAAEGKVSLAPEADQKTLTDAQRAAAVEQGGVPKHLVAVIEQVERRREPSRGEQADAAVAEPSVDDLRPRQWITTSAFADPVRVEQIQDTFTGTEVEVTTIRGDRRTLPEEELGVWQLADEPPNHRADGAPVAPQTRPQEGLFPDMGTDKDGNTDLITALEDDAPSEADPAAAETPPDEPAQSAELEDVEARVAAIEETQLAYFGRDIGSGGRATYGTIATHGGPQGDAAYQEARDGTREELAAIPESDQVAFDRAASRALAGIYNSEVYPGSVWGISGVIGKSVAVRQEMRRRGYPGPSLDYVDGTRVFQQLDEQYPDPNEVMDMGTFSWEVPDDLPERLAALNDEQLRGFTDMANLATVREDINSHAYYQALSLAVEERERRARAGQSHTPTPAEPGNIETLRARAQQEQQELNEQFVAEMVAEHGLTDQARDLLAGALAESPSSRKWYRRVLAADGGRVPNWAENVVRIVARPDIGQSEEGRAATSRVFRATRSLSRGDGRQDDSARRDIESAFEILGEEPYRGDEGSASARRPSSPSPAAAQEAQPGQASGDSAVPDISPARQQQLADLIEEQAARYVPTGDPGRYLSEVAGEQGVPRPGERAWIDAYLRDHPEVLTATGEERAARQQERAQQREADAARAKTLSRQARTAFDEGRFDEALELLDHAEEADPNGRDWNRVREVIRQGQADAAAPQPDREPDRAGEPTENRTAESGDGRGSAEEEAPPAAPAAPTAQPGKAPTFTFKPTGGGAFDVHASDQDKPLGIVRRVPDTRYNANGKGRRWMWFREGGEVATGRYVAAHGKPVQSSGDYGSRKEAAEALYQVITGKAAAPPPDLTPPAGWERRAGQAPKKGDRVRLPAFDRNGHEVAGFSQPYTVVSAEEVNEDGHQLLKVRGDNERRAKERVIFARDAEHVLFAAPENSPAQDDSPARDDESDLGAQRRQEAAQRAATREQATQERAEGDQEVRERAAGRQQVTALTKQAREAYDAGDVEEASRLLDEAEQLAPDDPRLGMIRRVIGEAQPAEDIPREPAPDGQAYADEIQVGDTLAEAQWRMAGPEAGALRAGEAAYANPAGPARLGEPERDSRRVTDIQQSDGGRITFTFDDGTRISRRPDALVTRGTPPDVEGGEDIPQANAQAGDRIRFDTAGPKLPAGLDRQALGIGQFDQVTVTGRISRRQPGMPSVVLDDVTITRADGTTAAAPDGTRFSVPRRVTRLDDSEPAPAPEQVPGAGLREGDRIVGPTGEVSVERMEQLDDALVSALVRDGDDRRERHLIASDRPVQLAAGGGDQVDEVEASGLAVGEWVVIDDAAVQVASVPAIEDGRARFDVRDQDGRLSEMELDERLLLARVTGSPARPPEAPPGPPAEPERITAVDLPDGTPTGRVRLRTDQRRRLLDLNLDATGSGTPPEVAQAAARLRARRELSAEQMQALAAHLRSLAADENTPATRRRALARTAGWVEAANARLEGFPPPPHDPGRPGPERTFARNLAMGDVIAVPGDDGTVRFGTVTATRPVKGFGLHTVHIRHEDGSVEQRVLPDGVDLWLMPDLPEDEPVRPQFTREHVTADRIDVGDTIRWDGSDFADPVVGQVLSVERRGGEFAETRLYEMTVLDGDDEQRTITVTDRGWPSVERLDRGAATSGQPYDSVMQPETAEYVGWRDLRVGDRAQVMMATGTITAITRHPAGGDVPEGATVRVMTDSGDERTVSVFDDPDMPDDYIDPSVMRLIPADDNAAARIAAVRREREQISREREFTAFLAELETTRSRWAATDVAQAMRELPAGAGREEALAAAMERLDRIDTMDDTAAATLAFRLGARDDTQAAAMASATSAVTGAVKTRATSRIRAALEGADLLGGETWPRALARVAAAYRDHPPAPGVLPAGVSLARLRDRLDGTPQRPASRLPDMPQDADLPARLAGYRAQLPEDLADLGRQPVSRTVFEPTTLEDLEAGRVPAVQQVTLWAPDIADDDGPGPEAMRQLAVLRTAGADLDVRFRQHLAGRADALGAELDAVTRERGQAWKTADDLDAEIARTRAAGGTPDEGLLGRRDDAAASWQAAAVRERELRRMLAEARREALAATLSEVRQVGGDGLDYTDRNGRPLTGRAGSNAAALRYVEEVLPSDWLAAAREAGPVEVVTGPGQHVHVRADGSTRISLPADDNTEIAPAIREGQPGRVPVPSAQPGGVAKATVAAHELGHHLEATVPGLREAGQALLWDRTSYGPVGERVRPEPMFGEDRGRPFEIYPGDFPDARTGRVNGDGTQEVFANVLESLAGGGDYADDDLRHWGLGVLALLATDATGPRGGTRREEGAERRDPLDGVNLLALSDEQLRALLARIDDPQAVARLRAVLDEREQRRTGRDDIDLTELSDAELESMLLAGWDGYGDDPERTALQDRVIAETEAREAERRRRGDDLGDLAASDLLSMDTDDLAALYGRNLGRYGMDPAVTSLLDQISAELEERDRRRDVGADPYAGMDLEGMSEEQLAELIERHQPLYHSDPWSGALVRRVIAELDERDRRQQPDDDRTPEEMRIDDLIAQGWEPREAYAEVYGLSEEEMDRQERLAVIDAERGAGERREQVVRRMYRQWVYEQALEAERATNGYMLSPLGRKAGVDPKRLWGGNADHAYAYASEELKRWWADQPNGGRMTYDEWRAQWLGDSRDRRQAQERRQTAGNGRDFG